MKKHRKHKVNRVRQQSTQRKLNISGEQQLLQQSVNKVGSIKPLVRFIALGVLNTFVGYTIYGL